MPIKGTFYTSGELQKILGVTKQRVSDLARLQEWQTHNVGVLYHADDVASYLWARWRRDLARKLGATVKELVSHDEWDKDDNCPVCEAFAIYRPATAAEVADLEIDVYGPEWPWLCINGHSNGNRRMR